MTHNKPKKQFLDMLGGSVEDVSKAKAELYDIYGDNLPDALLVYYNSATKWQVRAACVFYSIPFCRKSHAAVDLGVLALSDRSKIVRSRASQLLAYSLRKDVVSVLNEALARCNDETEAADLRAAIDAIRHQNHTYFHDRNHSGKVTVRVWNSKKGRAEGF